MRRRLLISCILILSLLQASSGELSFAGPRSAGKAPQETASRGKSGKGGTSPAARGPKGGDRAVRHVPFWACSDGKGAVSLFWLPGGGEWPAGGFRLERVLGKKSAVIARDLRPGGEAEAMAALDPGKAEAIRALADKIAKGTLTDEEMRNSIVAMGRAAAADITYGRALGVRYTDTEGGPGPRAYRLMLMDAAGQPIRTMETETIDPGRRTPAPPAPLFPKAEARASGTALFWSDPPAGARPPVVAYHVDRVEREGRPSSLTAKPLVLDRRPGRALPDFTDADPPGDAALYHIRAIDIFGRRSAPVEARISPADPAAPDPPRNVAARSGAPAVTVTWDEPSGAVAAGYVVERIPLKGKGYTRLTRPPLPSGTLRYEDGGIDVGAKYYYRLRSVDREGRLGPPSSPVFARAAPPDPSAEPKERGRAAKEPADGAALPAAAGPPFAPEPRGAPPGDPSGTAAARRPASGGEPSPSATTLAPSLNPFAQEKYGGLLASRDHGPAAGEGRDAAPPAAVESPPPTAPNSSPAEGDSSPAAQSPPAAEASPQVVTDPPVAERPSAVKNPPVAEKPPNAENSPAVEAPQAAEDPPADGSPPAPVVETIHGLSGKVTITLRPGDPEDRTTAFLVFRSESPAGPGMAAGRPLPADVRRWEDTNVTPGRYFWYHVVAVDGEGRRSAPSKRFWVRVGAP